MTSIAALPLETSASVPLEPSQPSTVKYEHSDKINEDNTEQFFGPEGIPKSSDESGPSPRVQFSGPSSSNNETSSTYSREELLALFRIDYPLPKEFVFHPFVISKEPLKPVAFTSPEEEEEESKKEGTFMRGGLRGRYVSRIQRVGALRGRGRGTDKQHEGTTRWNREGGWWNADNSKPPTTAQFTTPNRWDKTKGRWRAEPRLEVAKDGETPRGLSKERSDSGEKTPLAEGQTSSESKNENKNLPSEGDRTKKTEAPSLKEVPRNHETVSARSDTVSGNDDDFQEVRHKRPLKKDTPPHREGEDTTKARTEKLRSAREEKEIASHRQMKGASTAFRSRERFHTQTAQQQQHELKKSSPTLPSLPVVTSSTHVTKSTSPNATSLPSSASTPPTSVTSVSTTAIVPSEGGGLSQTATPPTSSLSMSVTPPSDATSSTSTPIPPTKATPSQNATSTINTTPRQNATLSSDTTHPPTNVMPLSTTTSSSNVLSSSTLITASSVPPTSTSGATPETPPSLTSPATVSQLAAISLSPESSSQDSQVAMSSRAVVGSDNERVAEHKTELSKDEEKSLSSSSLPSLQSPRRPLPTQNLSELQRQSHSQTQSQLQSEPLSQIPSQRQLLQTQPSPTSQPQPQLQFHFQSLSQTLPMSQTTQLQPQPQPQPQLQLQSQPQIQSQLQLQSQPQVQSPTYVLPRVQLQPEATPQFQTQPPLQLQAQPELLLPRPQQQPQSLASARLPLSQVPSQSVVSTFLPQQSSLVSSPSSPISSQSSNALPHGQAKILSAEETLWYYKDPRGNEHGPFSSQQMNEWFKHDFFGIDLSLKRGKDGVWVYLGELFLLEGRNVFTGQTLVEWYQLGALPPKFHMQLLKLQQALLQQQQQLPTLLRSETFLPFLNPAVGQQLRTSWEPLAPPLQQQTPLQIQSQSQSQSQPQTQSHSQASTQPLHSLLISQPTTSSTPPIASLFPYGQISVPIDSSQSQQSQPQTQSPDIMQLLDQAWQSSSAPHSPQRTTVPISTPTVTLRRKEGLFTVEQLEATLSKTTTPRTSATTTPSLLQSSVSPASCSVPNATSIPTGAADSSEPLPQVSEAQQQSTSAAAPLRSSVVTHQQQENTQQPQSFGWKSQVPSQPKVPSLRAIQQQEMQLKQQHEQKQSEESVQQQSQTDPFKTVWKLNFGDDFGRRSNIETSSQTKDETVQKTQSSGQSKSPPPVQTTESQTVRTDDDDNDDGWAVFTSDKTRQKLKKKQQRQSPQTQPKSSPPKKTTATTPSTSTQSSSSSSSHSPPSSLPSQPSESSKPPFAWNIPPFISAQPVVSVLKIQEEEMKRKKEELQKQQEMERIRQQQEMENNPLKSSVWASKNKPNAVSSAKPPTLKQIFEEEKEKEKQRKQQEMEEKLRREASVTTRVSSIGPWGLSADTSKNVTSFYEIMAQQFLSRQVSVSEATSPSETQPVLSSSWAVSASAVSRPLVQESGAEEEVKNQQSPTSNNPAEKLEILHSENSETTVREVQKFELQQHQQIKQKENKKKNSRRQTDNSSPQEASKPSRPSLHQIQQEELANKRKLEEQRRQQQLQQQQQQQQQKTVFTAWGVTPVHKAVSLREIFAQEERQKSNIQHMTETRNLPQEFKATTPSDTSELAKENAEGFWDYDPSKDESAQPLERKTQSDLESSNFPSLGHGAQQNVKSQGKYEKVSSPQRSDEKKVQQSPSQKKKKKKRNVVEPSLIGFNPPPSRHDISPRDDNE